jgi:hypothetical protein
VFIGYYLLYYSKYFFVNLGGSSHQKLRKNQLRTSFTAIARKEKKAAKFI